MIPVEAKEFTEALLVEYGLAGWTVRLGRAVRQFGSCYYGKKLITLSEPLVALNDQAVVLDVILHEIAHALAGPGTGHGHEWKKTARSTDALPIVAIPQNPPRFPQRDFV